ncbi:MAG: cytochrome c oxidase subunit II transmembrane domain-containing protein [Acidimicrobiia bacterium]
MSKTRRVFSIVIFTFVSALLLSSCATGPDNNQNSLRPKGEAAEKILNLYSPIFWIATTIGTGVLIAAIYVSIRYRATEKNKSPKQVHGNSVLEIGWTILPLVILIGVAIPTVKTVFDLDKKAGPGAVNVEVVGKQWWWQFGVKTDQYQVFNPDGTPKLNEFSKPTYADTVYTANELVVPVDTQIQLNIKACDAETPVLKKTTDELKKANPCNVIHSFWIPSLGGKADAVPGRDHRLVLKAKEKGIYTGQCAEYCGLSHSVMRMQIRAVSRAEYDNWLANMKKPPVTSSVAATGAKATSAQAAIQKFGCANCHTMDDPSLPSYGPNLTHFGQDFDNEVLGGGSIPKTYDHIWKWIFNATDWENGNGIPMQSDDCRLGVAPGPGKRCNGMPNFSAEYRSTDEKGRELILPAMTEQEAKDIATYLAKNK